MIKQRTLRNSIKATGVGLHNGRKVLLHVHPAPPDSGIRFRRMDCDPVVDIPAQAEYISDTRLCTTLAYNGVRVGTVEHLMSAFAGLGIDNALVELDTDEVPIMDGSSGPLVFLLQSAGIREQDADKRYLRIRKRIRVDESDKWVMFEPYNGFQVNFTISFEHPMFPEKNSSASFDFSTTSFVREVSRARTFGFVHEVEKLRENNLALGGSLDNAVVVDNYRILNEDGLRCPDEFVKHKILDAIGDLYLLQHSLIGSFTGFKSGHALNSILLKTLLADKSAFELVSFSEEQAVPIRYMSLQAPLA